MTPEQQRESDQLDADIRVHQLEIAVACVKREIKMRERVYPRQVARGRMKPEAAADETSAMRQVLKLLFEMQVGHATPEYVALCEAAGLYEHDGGHA